MKKFITIMPPYGYSVVVVSIVIYLTLFPDPLPATDMPFIEGLDKVVHGMMMMGVVLSLSFDYIRNKRHSIRMPLGIMVVFLFATIAFGAVIEIAQYLMEIGRGCEMSDFIADCIGAIIGLTLSHVWMVDIVRRLFR